MKRSDANEWRRNEDWNDKREKKPYRDQKKAHTAVGQMAMCKGGK